MTAAMSPGESSGLSPLSLAVRSGSLSSVRALVQQGALLSNSNSSAGDPSGFTPLHYAAERGDLPIIKFLLSHGASISQTDRRGRVPEAIAQLNQHQAAVKLFREFKIDDVILTKSTTQQPSSLSTSRLDQQSRRNDKKPRRIRAAESVENLLGLGLGRKSSVTRSLDEARKRNLLSRSGSTSSGSASIHHGQESSGSTNGSERVIVENRGGYDRDRDERVSRSGSAASSTQGSTHGRRRPSTAPAEKTTFHSAELASSSARSTRGSISRPSSRASISSGSMGSTLSPMMNLPFSSFNAGTTTGTNSQFYRPRKSSLLSSGFSSPLPPNSFSPSVPSSPSNLATPVFDDRDDEVDDAISFLNNNDSRRSSRRPSAMQSRRDSSATTHSSMYSSGTESALDKSRRPSEESLQYMKNRTRSIGEEFGAGAGASESEREGEESVTIKARPGATTTMSNSSSGRSSFSIPIPNRSDTANTTNDMRTSRSNSLSTQSSTSQNTGTTDPTEYSLSSDPTIPQSSVYPSQSQSQQPSANPNRSLSTLSPLYEMNHFAFLNPNSATAKPLTTAEARMKVKSVEKDLLNFNLNLPKVANRRSSEIVDPSTTLKARSRGALDVRGAGELGANERGKKSSLSEQLANYGRALALERNLKEAEEKRNGGVVFEVIKSAAGQNAELGGRASEKTSAVSTNGKVYGQPQWSLAPSRSPLIITFQSTAPADTVSPPDSPNRPSMKTTSTSQKIKSIRRPSLVGGTNGTASSGRVGGTEGDVLAARRGLATAEGERGVVYEVVHPKAIALSSRLDEPDSNGVRKSKKGPGRRSAGSSTDSSSKTTTSPATLDNFGVGVGAANGANGAGAAVSNGGGKLKGLKRFLGIKRR